MSEDIELHSYCITQKTESDSEEYHEIDQAMLDAAVSFKNKVSPSKEATFFTLYDADKSKNKARAKKKRRKKDNQAKNVMDIINAKIESDELPIEKNVIKIISEEQNTNDVLRDINIGKLYRDSGAYLLNIEHGFDHTRRVKLNPNFPNIEKGFDQPGEMVVPYVKPTIDFLNDSSRSESQQTAKFLDISFKHINFTHHHDFTLEKILTIQLQEYFKKYTEVQDSIRDILRSIDVNRKTRESLKEKFLNITPNKKNDLRFDPTIRRYTEAMLAFKNKYLAMIREKRELANTIISVWSDVKNVRKKVGAETSLEVEVNDISLNDDDFSKEWNNIFETEYSDMLVKLEFEYVTKYVEYKELKGKSDEINNKISKPKLSINPDDIKDEVSKIVDFLLNRNEIEIKLGYSKKGLKGISKNKYDSFRKTVYFKVYVDDVFVCESEHTTVEDHSKIDYHDLITLQIVVNNKTLSLILCEDGLDLSLCTFNINEIRKSSLTSEYIEKDFKCNQIVKPSMENVGSGFSIKDIASQYKVRLKSSNVFKSKLFTNCKVTLKIGWNDKLCEHQHETIKSFMNTEKQIKRMVHRRDYRNLDTLLEIINNIYDYDVEDRSIIDTLKDMCKSEIKDDDAFFVEDNPDNTRFKLLSLRNAGGFSNTTNKSIPLFQTQISTEHLSSLQKSEEKDFDVEYFESKRVEMDPIELQRYMGIKFVEKLNKKILIDLNDHLLRKTHKDVVMDFQDLSLRGIFSNKSNLSLDSSSSVTRKQLLKEGLAKEQEIHITILRALNLFDRRVEEETDADYDDVAGFRIRPLRPFVRVSYHSEIVQSPIALGSHPTWNYTARIKTKLDPLSSIHINIYDEHRVKIDQDSDVSSQSYRYRCYNKWLGTISVPMTTVINLGMLHGTFKISTPPFLFGYDTSTAETTSIIPEIMRLMRKDTAFITLRITTSLTSLGGCEVYNQPMETDDPIIHYLNTFITDYLVDFPSRNITLTLIDSSRKNRCVTEFIQPLPLPDVFPKDTRKTESASKSSKSSSSSRKKRSELNVREDTVFEVEKTDDSIYKMMDIAVRYVSLIPTYELVESHAVTLKGIELLKLQYGSPLDHSLLLASYFIHLNLKCWVVIGHGLPRGLSSYVMVKYKNNRIVMVNDTESTSFLNRQDAFKVVVFDAVSGEKHDVRDVGCPLKTASFVFNGENIWVNVQSSQDCENLSFDFTKSSNWQPVFDKSIFVMQQPAILTNIYSLPGDVENLRSTLEDKIKAKIQKWRWNVRTIWNRYLSNLLRECLPSWEYWSFNPDSEKPVVGQKLKQLMATYKIFGFPLNMNYLNTKSVVSRVKSTMIHMSDDPKVEFGLAVEVYAYPNNVLSVWVFLASMTRM